MQSYICVSQITFNRTYDALGSETIFNILPSNNGYKMVMNVNQTPDKFQFCSLNSLGDTITTKLYETPNKNTILFGLLQTKDSSFVTGCFYEDLLLNVRSLFLVKFDELGDTLWSKVISATPGYEFFGRYFIETSDGGFLFTGAYVDVGWLNSEVFILKTDSLGNLEWMNNFGGPMYDDAFSSIETTDKGFLTLGLTRSFGFGNSSNRDDLLVKWDSLGNYQWHKTFGSSDEEIGVGITKCFDGNYILGSGKHVNSNFAQGKIIKIDVDGNIIWQKLFGNRSDSFWWVREKSNFDLVAIGSEKNINNKDDGFIVCTDSAGNEKWQRNYRFGSEHCYFRDIKETLDGGIICAGFVFDGASGGQDGWLVKLDSTGCLSTGNCGEPTGIFETPTSSQFHMSISPNPVSTQAMIKIDGLTPRLLNEPYLLQVYNLQGQLVQSPKIGFLVSDTWIQCVWKPYGLIKGIYMIAVTTYDGERLGTVKVIVD